MAITLPLAACGAAFAGYLWLVRGETIKTAAPTAEEASTKGAWVPNFVPLSVRDFEETHDIDTNSSSGSFRYGDDEETQLFGALLPLPVSEISNWHWGNKMGIWRPELPLSEPELTASGVLLRKAAWDTKFTPFSRYTVVVDARTKTIYFWTE